MDAVPQNKALGTLETDEWARFFVAERFGALECLSATFTSHAYVPHRHETYVVGAIFAGCETWRAGGTRHYAGPGEFVFLDPEIVHDGEPLSDGYSYRMCYPSVDLVRRIAAEIDGRDTEGLPSFRGFSARDPEGAALFGAAHAAMDAGEDPLGAEEAMVRALARCLVLNAGIRPIRLGRESGPVARVRDRLEAEYHRDHRLEDLAAEVGLSRHQLIRAFRKEVGLTPHAYLVDRRVVAARRHLGLGERPADVAAAVGFADQAHLTRAFKARLGITPGRYRAAFLQ